jgi:glycosyltransferase involved in cell wall biosynthesis
MRRGLPIVATRVGGNVELVHEGMNGFLVDSEDIDQLATAIRTLCSSDVQSMGQASYRMVQNRFAEQHMIDAFIEVWQKVVLERSFAHNRHC